MLIFIVVLFLVGGRDETPVVPEARQLNNAASTHATFKFRESGPIVAEEDHYRIEISVSRSSRTIDVYRGYGNLKVASSSFNNTEESFSEFLSALDRSG